MTLVETEAPAWAGTLAERGANCLMSTYARYPLELAAGEGCRVTDSAGRVYLDFLAGIAVSVLGHRHPAVTAAIAEAANGLLHTSNLYWTEPGVRLAERLTRAAGMERAFLCNSGTEAVEAALKMARRARPGRSRFVVCERSFHGRSLGALSATAQEKYQAPFRPLLAGFEVIPFGDAAAVDAAVGSDTAAVLVEPIQGEGGVRPAPAGWLAHARAACDRSGALLICDEIQCGLGRSGALFVYQAEGVAPDAVVVAKALGGGLPIGALLARGEAAAAFTPGDHGSTFGGGPFVTHVADAVLRTLVGDGFLAGVTARGERFGRGLAALAAASPATVEARGRGLMWGLVLAEPKAAALVDELRDRGLLAAPAGADVVRFLPPLVVSDAEVDEALDIVAAAVARLPSPATVEVGGG